MKLKYNIYSYNCNNNKCKVITHKKYQNNFKRKNTKFTNNANNNISISYKDIKLKSINILNSISLYIKDIITNKNMNLSIEKEIIKNNVIINNNVDAYTITFKDNEFDNNNNNNNNNVFDGNENTNNNFKDMSIIKMSNKLNDVHYDIICKIDEVKNLIINENNYLFKEDFYYFITNWIYNYNNNNLKDTLKSEKKNICIVNNNNINNTNNNQSNGNIITNNNEYNSNSKDWFLNYNLNNNNKSKSLSFTSNNSNCTNKYKLLNYFDKVKKISNFPNANSLIIIRKCIEFLQYISNNTYKTIIIPELIVLENDIETTYKLVDIYESIINIILNSNNFTSNSNNEILNLNINNSNIGNLNTKLQKVSIMTNKNNFNNTFFNNRYSRSTKSNYKAKSCTYSKNNKYNLSSRSKSNKKLYLCKQNHRNIRDNANNVKENILNNNYLITNAMKEHNKFNHTMDAIKEYNLNFVKYIYDKKLNLEYTKLTDEANIAKNLNHKRIQLKKNFIKSRSKTYSKYLSRVNIRNQSKIKLLDKINVNNNEEKTDYNYFNVLWNKHFKH